jgi:two-component system response regulator HydG
VRLGDGVMERLLDVYDFPGNVRELENLVEQSVALCTNGVIRVDDILPRSPKSGEAREGRTLADIVDDAERVAVESALRQNEGSRERAAEALDISPTTLWRKMNRLGITYDDR